MKLWRYVGNRIAERTSRRLLGAFAGAALTAAGGCQNNAPTHVLDLADMEPVPAVETAGSGPVQVAMLLPRASAEPLRTRARDMHDAAKLALEELGGGALTLVTYDTRAGEGADPGPIAQRAAEASAALIVGPVTAKRLAAVATHWPASHPPALLLSSYSGAKASNALMFVSDEIDSALKGVGAALSTDRANVLAIMPASTSQEDETRLHDGIASQGGKLLDVVRYAEGTDGKALPKEPTALDQAQILLILGGEPAKVMKAMRRTGALRTDLMVIGTNRWPHATYSVPELEGAVIALLDQESLRQIGERYEQRFGRPLSENAAYSYDAVATIAGIVRAAGADALTADTLTARTGFRGATGIFRFGQNGMVERYLALYRVSDGKLSLLQPSPAGF